MVQKRTIARFDEWVKSPENLEAFFALMERDEKPLRFRDACVEARVPYTLMHAYMKATAAVKARYYAVLSARAQELTEATLEDAEGAKDRDSAAAARVKIETKRWVASKWDKELYGEQRADGEGDRSPLVDAALLGAATELLRIAREKRAAAKGVVVEVPVLEKGG